MSDISSMAACTKRLVRPCQISCPIMGLLYSTYSICVKQLLLRWPARAELLQVDMHVHTTCLCLGHRVCCPYIYAAILRPA